jgi:curved DNA-binding protein CbpA
MFLSREILVHFVVIGVSKRYVVENFYEILGVPNTADQAMIRAAFKKLAMHYHPDRNPNDPESEDMFKKINEAYHTLSDPVKKLRYDSNTILLPLFAAAEYEREMKRRRYWYWRKYQEKTYILDKEYFKIQGLAFLVFIVISGFCFALIHTAHYIMEQKYVARWNENSKSLHQVNALFIEGHFDDAFSLIQALKEKDPHEFRFLSVRDSLVNEFRQLAENKFKENNFPDAVTYFTKLSQYEDPVRSETISRISLCQYYLGNFKESLQALKHLHNQTPRDLELVYQIGIINLEKLENPNEAMRYFTLGKKLFKQNLTQVYGEAFELILEPADVPEIYYDIFEARAKCNLGLKNYNEAVTDCNWAVFLRPQYGVPYKLRSEAFAALNRKDRVCRDLYKAEMRGVSGSDYLKHKFCR